MAGYKALAAAQVQSRICLRSQRHGNLTAPRVPCQGKYTVGRSFADTSGRGCRTLRRTAVASTSQSPRGPVDSTSMDAYTPYQFLSYSKTKSEVTASVTVDAPAAKCFDTWYDRNNHFMFLTLAEQIGYDGENSADAIYMFLYRFAKLPILQMMTEIERTEVVPGELIRFQNTTDEAEGEAFLPLAGEVKFAGTGSSGTEVTLSLSYGIPNLLIDEVGATTIEHNVRDILQDNMGRFKALVEKSV